MKQTLESRIGYHFRDERLLETAVTHSSYANERHSADAVSYERLEFLGDSILGLTTAEYLYAHTPALPEGRMTRLRAELVCESSLHKTALALGLGEFMRLGRGEEALPYLRRAWMLMKDPEVAAHLGEVLWVQGHKDEARKYLEEAMKLDPDNRSLKRVLDRTGALPEAGK